MDIKLKSGTEVYAKEGIIGISPDLGLTEGYDSSIHLNDMDGRPYYSDDDLREIADMMIARWQQFRDGI